MLKMTLTFGFPVGLTDFIPRLYNPEHIIDDSTFMILINTIYFHMEWEQKFDKASTTKASFFPCSRAGNFRLNDELLRNGKIPGT